MERVELVRRLRFLKVKSHDGNEIVRQAAGEIEKLEHELGQVSSKLDLALSQLQRAAACDDCLHLAVLNACESDELCHKCSAWCYCKDCKDGSKWEWQGGCP